MKYPPIAPTTCHFCGKVIYRRKTKSGLSFCNTKHKADWQRTLKPVTREWLIKHYVEMQEDCSVIAKLVNRNSKRVWEWLKNEGIETRRRGTDKRQHFTKGHTLSRGRKHTEETKAKIRAIAIAQGRVPYDPKVGSYMKGRSGAATPNWKGGITADRQALYGSKEWIAAAHKVYGRDKNCCQRCGQKRAKGIAMDIHHIVPFAHKPLRADPSNLVLLCERCHYWVHGKENKEQLFIKAAP